MIQFLQQLFQRIVDFFRPDSYFAWQTVIYLGLFSWLMYGVAVAADATAFTRFILSLGSWVFIAIGAGWFVENKKIRIFGLSLAPWVSGAILCAFLFGSLPASQVAPALITWPLISVSIVAIPHFFSWNLKPRLPHPGVRQHLVLLLGIALLLSSWFQFYFRIQDWLEAYPGLMADSFENSDFVYQIPNSNPPLTSGMSLLSLTEEELQAQINNKPWPWVERWLLNLDEQTAQMREQSVQTMLRIRQEQDFWDLEVKPSPSQDGYRLDLRAIWTGPAATAQSYYYQKSCSLLPVTRSSGVNVPDGSAVASTETQTTVWSNLSCDLQTVKIEGPPI